MDKNYPTVTIGCPCRDRALYLPHYLSCILNLDYPKENITLLFIENDSKDQTLQILHQFKKENSNLYHRVKIDTYNQNTPQDERSTHIREKFTYSALSKLRNYFNSQIKSDYALSCDSDIMMPPNTLKKLISHQLDYVSGLIVNGYLYEPNDPGKYKNILQRVAGNSYTHISNYRDGTLIPVDFSGAVMLMSNKACKTGKFSYHKQGEDAGFCESLIANGIKLWCDTSAKCTHCMNEEYLNKYVAEEFTF